MNDLEQQRDRFLYNWYYPRFWVWAVYLAGLGPTIWIAREGGGPALPMAWLIGAPVVFLIIVKRRERQLFGVSPLGWRIRLIVFASAAILMGFLGVLGQLNKTHPAYFEAGAILYCTSFLVFVVFMGRRIPKSDPEYATRRTAMFVMIVFFACLIVALGFMYLRTTHRL
jgi:hypothetical protein